MWAVIACWEQTPVLYQAAEKKGASPWKCVAPLDVNNQTQVQTILILNQPAEQDLAVVAGILHQAAEKRAS